MIVFHFQASSEGVVVRFFKYKGSIHKRHLQGNPTKYQQGQEVSLLQYDYNDNDNNCHLI